MAISQATYAPTFARGFPGMVANGETSNRISRTVEDAAGIAYGKAVFRGANLHGATGATTGGAANFLGFAIANLAHTAFVLPGAGDTGADVYGLNSTAGIMTQGVMWVIAAGTATAGADVYVATNGDISNTNTGVLTGWKFDEPATAGALVKIAKR
ncbi:structural cement protein Gp24 [Sphingomonas abaci]|uniref:DUF2190 domain-containing protein n=1 Tax=Sphingomonas abaci TaxID=237611 RepID=A0A7W7AIZ9_9SPHN|nr:hypothetical protein [Sphingomonas abaci]MBB4616917.1 hypothetical protein [Sphingomonas abaci]